MTLARPVESVGVVPDGHDVVVYGEDIAVAGEETGQVHGLSVRGELVVGLDP